MPRDLQELAVAVDRAAREVGFHRAEQRAELERLTAILTPRDRRIVALRFQEDLTQEQIGRLTGLSQMQISRILRQAITKIRAHAIQESSNGVATESPIDADGQRRDTAADDGPRTGLSRA